MTRAWYALIAVFALVACGLIHLKKQADLQHAAAAYRHESHDESQRVADRIEHQFAQVFEGLRTIARLPGVRRIDSSARSFDANARATTQEIYNNLASGFAISEVYVVPRDLNPDAPGAAHAAPLVTFDELIVGRTADERPDLRRSGPREIVPEVEIHEYRLMRQQLAKMAAEHPLESGIRGLDYPAYGGPEVVTCDNSRYDPRRPDDRDRSGLVYSVPFYGDDGALRGAISGVVLTHVLRDLLPDGRYVLHNAADGWLAPAHESGEWQRHVDDIRADRAAPGLIYSEVLPLRIRDTSGEWRLWIGAPDNRYWARSDVVAAWHAAALGYLLVAILALALVLRVRDNARRIAEQQHMNVELAERVRHRTLELELERDRAQAATRAKSEFLANMSHEIRTPMNGVLGMLDLLSMTPQTKEQSEFSGIARDSAEALLGILNDILDFSKVEAGALELEEIPFDLHRAIEEPCVLLAHRAQEKGLELACYVPDDVPRGVRGDPLRLRQVLINLVGNAIKFTEHGEVVVWTSATTAGDGTVRVTIEVRDSGIGISPEVRTRLFQAFSQADGSMTRRYGGTGLGLAISARIVQMMGGDIDVQSEPGRGATFRFDIVLRAAPELDVPQPGLAAQRIGRLRVLLVDDNATSRLIVEHHLDAWGFDRESTASVAEAQAALERAHAAGRPFGLVLLDLGMPDRDGLALGRAMQMDERFRGVARIVLCAHGGTDAASLEAAGIAICHVKPVRPSQLLDDIASLFGLPQETPGPAKSVAAPPSIDGSGTPLTVLLVEDNIVNQKVALGALRRLGVTASLATDGEQAVARLSTERFDLVLMDCQMPVMDGFAATRAVREREAGEALPRQVIVAMTANAMAGDRELCLEAGMDDYLTKPFNLGALLAVMEKWLPGFTVPADVAQKRNV